MFLSVLSHAWRYPLSGTAQRKPFAFCFNIFPKFQSFKRSPLCICLFSSKCSPPFFCYCPRTLQNIEVQSTCDRYVNIKSGMLCILLRERLWCYFCSVKPAYSYGITRASRWRLPIPFFFYCLMLLDSQMTEKAETNDNAFTTWMCPVSAQTSRRLCVRVCAHARASACACAWPGDVLAVGCVLCGRWICSDIRIVPCGAMSSRFFFFFFCAASGWDWDGAKAREGGAR